MALGTDLTAQAPPAPRIPKLKYRNPLPADQIAQLPVHPHSIDAQDVPASPSSKAPSSDYRPSFETASLTSSSLASTHSSAGSSNDSSRSAKKKKKGSVLGFLSLKEPSQLALEQFAQAQRKQASEKTSPTPSVRAASIYSSHKLPAHVPKVNSKWDGIPDSVKHRHSSSNGSVRKRMSVSSHDSKGSHRSATTTNTSKFSVHSDGTSNPPNTIASPEPSLSNLTISDDDVVVDRSSTAALPQLSYYFPEPLASGALPIPDGQATPQQPLATSLLSPPSPEFRFDTRDLSDQPEYPRPDSPASSTGSVDTIVRDTADAIFTKLNDQPHKSFFGDAPAVQPPVETKPTAIPESHDFLFGDLPEEPKADSPMTTPVNTPVTPPVAHYVPTRSVQNFSRPISSPNYNSSANSNPGTSYRTTPRSSGLPTLYEASLASTDFDEDEDDNDDAESIAPSTIAPSELSEHWFESPRERLGLGGRLRLGDVLPWESQGQGDSPGKRKSRLSMFGKVTSRA